ncbi:hypothetical protein M407DRAFT_20311 [Tulasnella calospora MUT 4182]|uniref:Uncharacterized protein n=1 Tax=Tulasnella calospora MUT 4182 TaxID=1051891 RepID=A0A0C3QQ68_9AGAM|nr:hypothetical protein M407DRAFT_20311 [Tulasnella calospora MUT 4182]
MYSAHGPLEALLTSDDDTIEAAMPSEALVNPNPIVWISFAGGPNESAASFIQSIQRVAFQQNRIKDDEWIAELASTCFTDKALVWYLGLGKETQSSWTRLRIALVRHYLVQIPAQAPRPSPARTPPQPKPAPPQPKAISSATTDIGWIEVVRPEFGDLLGLLSQDSTGKFVVDPSPEKALKLQKVLHTDSIHQQLKIYSLKFVDAIYPQFPFLGLKLVKSPGEDPNFVPPQHSNSYVLDCFSSSRTNGGWQSTTAYATWDFVQTTESEPGPYYLRKAEGTDPKARVISAVWTSTNMIEDVAELGLTWPSGDNRSAASISEIKLDAILQKGGIEGLHVHRHNLAADASNESHVALIFRKTSGP